VIFTIYLITNKVNGKVYVGQTRQTLEERWKHHCAYAKRGFNYPICKAIRKYKPEGFTITEIATCETQEWTNYLERMWIVIKDSCSRKIGYNVRVGGDASPMSEDSKKLLSESIKKMWSEGHYSKAQFSPSEETRKRISEANLRRGPLKPEIKTEDILEMWNNNATSKEIAERFSISSQMVYDRINKSGLPHRPIKSKKMDFDLKKAQKLRLEGLSYSRIAREMNNHLSFVYFKLNPDKDPRKKTHDSE